VESSPALIPNYVKAKSDVGLRRAMLMENLRAKKMHRYFDIQNVGGFWYAWFYSEVDLAQELSNKIKNGG
jgi:hypothetical protein